MSPSSTKSKPSSGSITLDRASMTSSTVGIAPQAYRPAQDAVSVIAAETVPQIQLDALVGQLDGPLAREAGEHRVERLVLGDARLEGFLAAEARSDLQRLAAVIAEAREDPLEEGGVGDRLTD